ncbi:hypothetical protein [Candidatus Nitrosotalea bavarica]|uniref:hypothetical protein n=1 Tax=Candidatus Nitrosotalea bavarica TaxID=1903277 RepID=UPI00105660B3|nr:hypothetical protein [Candidatus Nitrosotalea bavarica]
MLKQIIAKLKSWTLTKSSSDDISTYQESGKKTEQEEMNEEAHQLELKENYEQDEQFEESEK